MSPEILEATLEPGASFTAVYENPRAEFRKAEVLGGIWDRLRARLEPYLDAETIERTVSTSRSATSWSA